MLVVQLLHVYIYIHLLNMTITYNNCHKYIAEICGCLYLYILYIYLKNIHHTKKRNC